MNRIALFLFLTFATISVSAQNKSLAVGTATVNPNAALHVESPTGNQGAIMPRLTTAQRTAMAGILGAADAGILLYDNDLKALFIWDGDSWESSAKLSMPFKDSVTTATGTPDLFALKYNNAENKRVMRIESLNPTNGSSAVSISNNSNGLGLYIQNSNVNTISSSIFATNASNNLVANPSPVGVYGEATGLAASGGSFRNTNVNNDRAALYAETLGVGPTVFSRQSGVDGHAGYFWVADANNFGNPVRAQTDGIGSAMRLEVTNPANTSAALQINHSGTGDAINAVKTTNGSVANFQNADPTNTYNVLELSTSGNGYALNASSTGNQRVAYFTLSNPTSTAPAVSINSDALVQALEVFGSGQGRAATFQADGAAEAVQVRTDGANSKAATFLVTNAGNAQAAIESISNGTGPALQLNQTNGGLAFQILAGGVKNSVVTESIPGLLSAKAAIINIDVAGTYTLSTAGRVNGETIIVASEDNLGSVIIDLGGGVEVRLEYGKSCATFVFLNGTWRGTGAVQP